MSEGKTQYLVKFRATERLVHSVEGPLIEECSHLLGSGIEKLRYLLSIQKTAVKCSPGAQKCWSLEELSTLVRKAAVERL